MLHSLIRYANYDGSGRQTVIQGTVAHVFSITLFEDYMYWSDWNHKAVEKANRFTGADRQILKNLTHRPMDVQVYHPLRQINSKYLLNPDDCYIRNATAGFFILSHMFGHVEQKLPARSQKSLVFLKSLFFGQWEI
jgi:hypothetical protein